MNRKNSLVLSLSICAAALAACQGGSSSSSAEKIGTTREAVGVGLNKNGGTYNLHLQDTVRFDPVKAGSDVNRGRALFGIAADMETEDKSGALFQGFSQAFGGTVVSNGRTCFTCHRGLSTGLGLPPPPLSAHVPLTDALFTGLHADAQQDPDGMHNLDQLGLIKYRPHRFNLTKPQSDPYRQVFGWRKSIRLVNLAFAHGFLNDARGRTMFETDRGAVFSHTQESDNRFDELFSVQNGNDMEAFQFSVLSDPRLAALRDKNHPLHDTLVNDPFYTVNITTQAQARGKQVFVKNCMSCHNTPNVFNNASNVEALGNGTRPPNFPSFAPAVARTYNIGVAERNRHNLRFTHDDGGGHFTPIVLPLANAKGDIVNYTVTKDPGLGAITGRVEDIGRFKVPQLRGVKDAAPYFHDNSAFTLEEVVDYFNSDMYNSSQDGRLYPIHMSSKERADLLEFLKIL
jgi:hypothetical protein